ncbi:MAG: hypothetical protein N0E59_21715 [Candidatus Thiodiazotropha taylori]|nr:hypothetical protein [Candidatus Thiodiazotropha taylori]MCG8096932.1 hypothetical protein [Candidatus Thiodiazotropha endolucinida]MCG8109099.1 hypothetical protein [Candidatus Thiodiazotropha taylori]MCG8113378.1 hypothetical protein [Candidatus Thiodiazotropha taylori]MCW4281435.1 hypothetical protein [Candidatus Thiodiazotropha taylori]
MGNDRITNKSTDIIESLANKTGVSKDDVAKITEALGLDKVLYKIDKNDPKALNTLDLNNAKFGFRLSSGGSDV